MEQVHVPLPTSRQLNALEIDKSFARACAKVIINEIPRLARKFNVSNAVVMTCLPPECLAGAVELRESGEISHQQLRTVLDVLFCYGAELAVEIMRNVDED